MLNKTFSTFMWVLLPELIVNGWTYILAIRDSTRELYEQKYAPNTKCAKRQTPNAPNTARIITIHSRQPDNCYAATVCERCRQVTFYFLLSQGNCFFKLRWNHPLDKKEVPAKSGEISSLLWLGSFPPKKCSFNFLCITFFGSFVGHRGCANPNVVMHNLPII